jgi:hypothetical protein
MIAKQERQKSCFAWSVVASASKPLTEDLSSVWPQSVLNVLSDTNLFPVTARPGVPNSASSGIR